MLHYTMDLHSHKATRISGSLKGRVQISLMLQSYFSHPAQRSQGQQKIIRDIHKCIILEIDFISLRETASCDRKLLIIPWKMDKIKSAWFFFSSSFFYLFPFLCAPWATDSLRNNSPSSPCCASPQWPCTEVGHGGTTRTRSHHKLPHQACHKGRLPRQCGMQWHLCGMWQSVALRDPLSSHGTSAESPQYSSRGRFLLGMLRRACSQHQGCDRIPALQEQTRRKNMSKESLMWVMRDTCKRDTKETSPQILPKMLSCFRWWWRCKTVCD